jgi:hypothetical protein
MKFKDLLIGKSFYILKEECRIWIKTDITSAKNDDNILVNTFKLDAEVILLERESKMGPDIEEFPKEQVSVRGMLPSIKYDNGLSAQLASTPSSNWKANGEADPHKPHYDHERAKLSMGNLTDDELANAAFLNYDNKYTMEDIISGKVIMPLAYMTAVKDRIRWLSRALEKELAKSDLHDLKQKVSGITHMATYFEHLDKDFKMSMEDVAKSIRRMEESHMMLMRKMEAELEIASGEPHH